jgi:branched-subunit amino acid transport protein AzlD
MAEYRDILIILVIAICTFLTRLLPFALFGKSHEPPRLVRYLGQTLPASVIAVLIVYSLRTMDFSSVPTFLPAILSIAIIVVLHLWKRNMLLSIGIGTLSYMVLVQMVF